MVRLCGGMVAVAATISLVLLSYTCKAIGPAKQLQNELVEVWHRAHSKPASSVEIPFQQTIQCMAPWSKTQGECSTYGDPPRCINRTKCAGRPFRVYVYPKKSDVIKMKGQQFEHMLAALRSPTLRPIITDKPEEACLFFPNVDAVSTFGVKQKNEGAILRALPYWNHGYNHVVVDLFDLTWTQYNYEHSIRWVSNSVPNAPKSYVRGVDLGIPLEPTKNPRYAKGIPEAARRTPPDKRPIFASFKGQAFKTAADTAHRRQLLPLNDNKTWIVEEYCSGAGGLTPKHLYGNETCKDIKEREARFRYNKLMAQSKFCLVPEGLGAHSYRLMECFAWGSIPVLITDTFEPPLSELLDYTKFSIRVGKAAIPRLKAILGAVAPAQQAALHRNLVTVYDKYFRTIELWARAGMDVMQRRVHCEQLQAIDRRLSGKGSPQGLAPIAPPTK